MKPTIMKQMYTPLFVLLLMLSAAFTMQGANFKAIPSQSQTIVKEQLPVDQGNASVQKIKIQPAASLDPIISMEQISVSPEKNHTMISQADVAINAVASPVISDVYINGFWQGLFYGVVLLLVIINFVSFVLFDEKIYLVYGSSLVALAAFLFFSDGFMAFFDMHNVYNVEIVKASFYLVTAIASAIFGSYFLNLNTLFPKLKFVATGVFAAAAITLISGWFLETELFAVASNVLATAVIMTYFIMGIRLFSQKNYVKLYVIAMAFPILFTLDYLLSGPFSLSFLHIELTHIKGAVLVQILMLTYAILYRMKEIKEENLIKQTELKIFLKRQEMTSRQKTEKHIEDVYLENVIMQYDLDGFEIKLLQFISEGKTNEKICRKLKLSENDLEEATNELYTKLEIREHIKEDYHMVESQPDFIYN